MVIDIGVQIFLVFIFGLMTAICKKAKLDWGVIFFGWGTAILFIAFAIADVSEAVGLIK